MEHIREEASSDLDRIVENISKIRRFEGRPADFWPAFLTGSATVVGAEAALLVVRTDGEDQWRRLAAWPEKQLRRFGEAEKALLVGDIAGRAAENGHELQSTRLGMKGRRDTLWAGVRLDLQENGRTGVAVYAIDRDRAGDPGETVVILRLIADLPAVYQIGRMMRQAQSDVVQFADALDFMVLINAEHRYMAAAMTFCNEIASRYRCQRVSLGWLKDRYIRLQAVSHMEKFERKMDAVQNLEAAMEEAFDQDEEIVYPAAPGSTAIAREHEAFARNQGTEHMVSLPIRVGGEPQAVLTCERGEEEFSELEVRGLRVLCDQAARRLADLRERDRWFGARMAAWGRRRLSGFFGVENTFTKVLGLLIALALGILIFGQWDYRVEAPFVLKTDDLAYLPAPFEGYIDVVDVQVGDLVAPGTRLLSLDTRELLLEQASALASVARYAREEEKARAQNALADMKVARALKRQAQAKLASVQYHLDNALVKAPFAGIVVEGDLKKMQGAPVQKGDILFKVARIDKMYAELKIDEHDIHEVADGRKGQIAFVSQPDLKFPISVKRIEPMALTEEEGNVFVARGEPMEPPAAWWRPGMSGIAKVEVGQRNLLWIFTHRTVDFFRLLFWW